MQGGQNVEEKSGFGSQDQVLLHENFFLNINVHNVFAVWK